MQSHAIDGGVIVALRRLAALDRRPGGEGEAAAARLLRTELEHRGARAWIQEARVRRTHRGSLGLLSAAAALGSLGHRRTAIAAGVLAAALAADEPGLGAGPQRGPLRGRTAHSVIAEPGHAAGPETLVVCAHHDAAPTASGGGLGRARVRRLGGVLATASAAAMANIAPGRTPPGAGDSLSAVGVLLALADELVRRPTRRLRVLLLCAGSESLPENLCGSHLRQLDPQRTTFLCLQSVGSQALTLVCAEGLLRARRYPREPAAVLAKLAAEAGVPLQDACRLSVATRGRVPLRAGYRTAVLCSLDARTAPAADRRPGDAIGRLQLDTMGGAARLAVALVRHLDGR